MIVRAGRRRFFNIPRGFGSLGDACPPPEPPYESCGSGTLESVYCEQRNAARRTDWVQAVADCKCATWGIDCQAATGSPGAYLQGGTWVTTNVGTPQFVPVANPVIPVPPTPNLQPKLVAQSNGPSPQTVGSGASSSNGPNQQTQNPAPTPSGAFDWLTGSLFAGIPNWMLAAAGIGAVVLMGGRR